MRRNINEYIGDLKGVFDEIIATDAKNRAFQFDEAADMLIKIIARQNAFGKKLMLIGNGASASIASHIAVDFWKRARVRAISFNDAAGLTCISNDFGYKHVFEKPIEMFADSGDILIAISSSGQSENILLAAKAAKAKGVKIITFSGFKKDNPLCAMGEINFYVPSDNYGHVEIVHLSICHLLADMMIQVKNGQVQNRQP